MENILFITLSEVIIIMKEICQACHMYEPFNPDDMNITLWKNLDGVLGDGQGDRKDSPQEHKSLWGCISPTEK